jgi:hypothetical protein
VHVRAEQQEVALVVASSTVLSDGEAVTAELEVVVDPAMGGQEALCMARRLESLHLPLSFSRRLVRHLGGRTVL